MDTESLANLFARQDAVHGAASAPEILGDLFDLQRALATDPARKKVALCSRRSGKTVAASYILADALNRAHLDEVICYAARTRAVAKGLIWEKLKAINRRFELGWQFREVDLQVVRPNGGQIWLVGLDKEAEKDKLRGIKSSLIVLDEPATYAHLIAGLVREVLEPALGDLRGTLCVLGTPGIVCSGWWYEVSSGRMPGWSKHSWRVTENPYFDDPEGYLRQRLSDNAWDESNPTYMREDRGLWVQDEGDLVFKYLPSRNDCVRAPHDLDTFAVGCDFGMRDETAFVVLGWKENTGDIYVLEAMKEAELLPEEAAHYAKNFCEKYDPRILVGDSSGLGVAYVEQFNRRYTTGRKMESADKKEKRSFIDLLNGDFRTGRLKIVRDSCTCLIEELQLGAWNAKRTEIASGCADHAMDALLYAWRHSTHYRQRHVEQKKYDPYDFGRLMIEEDEAYHQANGLERPWWDR